MARSPELGSWASLLAVAVLLPRLAGLAAGPGGRVSPGRPRLSSSSEHLGGYGSVGRRARDGGHGGPADRARVHRHRRPLLVRAGGLRFTPKALSPVLADQPKTGFKKVFSTQGVWSLGKTLVKLCILAGMGYMLLHQLMGSVLGGTTLPLPTTHGITGTSTSAVFRNIGVVALLVAVADYVFQRRSYQQGLRMSKQEVKDENRRNDGYLGVRRALRSKARQLSRMRMMAAVASADVIVTNPTHFASPLPTTERRTGRRGWWPRVPISSRPGSEPGGGAPHADRGEPGAGPDAPYVVPGGRRRPAALYTAVARLLAFIFSLSPTAKMLGDVHRMAPMPLGATG